MINNSEEHHLGKLHHVARTLNTSYKNYKVLLYIIIYILFDITRATKASQLFDGLLELCSTDGRLFCVDR